MASEFRRNRPKSLVEIKGRRQSRLSFQQISSSSEQSVLLHCTFGRLVINIIIIGVFLLSTAVSCLEA